LLLDGQQRLTALYALIRGVPPPFFEGEELAFDLWFNVVTEEFRYHSTSVMNHNPTWFSVHEFLRNGMKQFLEDLPTLDPLRQEVAQKSLGRFNQLDRIHTYSYQVDDLKDESLTLDEVVDIFNRINSKGTPLSRADLAMAHISTFWPEGRSVVREFTIRMAEHGFKIDPAFLIRATSAVAGGSVNFDAKFYKLAPDALQDSWPRVVASFEYLAKVLRYDAYIDSLTDFSSPLVLVPILVHLAQNGGAFSDDTEKNGFIRWMYLANIWGRYTGQTDTKLRQDIAALSQPEPIAKLIEAIVNDRGRIRIEPADLEGKESRSGLYKFAYILARSRGAKDWFTGEPLYQKAIGQSNGLHGFHIFPRVVLKQMGVTERAIVNQVANMAFLSQKVNPKVADQLPQKYLPKVEDRVPGALIKQNVPMQEDLWQKSEYLAFFARRRKLLANAMNAYLLRLGTLGDGAIEEVGVAALLEERQSQHLEFRPSLRWDYEKGFTNRDLERDVVEAIAGFLNSGGGKLVIGVDHQGHVLGLAPDYCSSTSIDDRSGFEKHLSSILDRALGDARTLVTITFHAAGRDDICLISIGAAYSPVYLQADGSEEFYVRKRNTTRLLDPAETVGYVDDHWSP
jgi:hypothetical protein